MIEVTLIFPAYNKAKRIAETVSSAVMYFAQRDIYYEIIVSADGNDGTREIVEEMSKGNPYLKVIGSIERRGKRYGIRQAVRMAKGQIIGFADADDKTPIGEFDNFHPFLKEGGIWSLAHEGKRKAGLNANNRGTAKSAPKDLQFLCGLQPDCEILQIPSAALNSFVRKWRKN